ncbi:hypothetical protein ACXZBD_11970, partial [Escherichia coli]
KRAYCLKIQPATGSFARNLIYSTKPPSGILAPVEADARRYLEWDATFVAVGSDLGVFRSATQKLADTFKK